MRCKLCVGGTDFVTSRETLTKDGHSFFARMADDPNGFIDRDPTHFSKILNYLRDGLCIAPTNVEEMLELKTEAAFYGLTHLERQLGRLAERHVSPHEQMAASIARIASVLADRM